MEMLKILYIYIGLTYLISFCFVVYATKETAMTYKKDYKKAYPYLIAYSLFLAFAPIMLPIGIGRKIYEFVR